MTRKTDAWMPIWIGDYLADTQRLTTEQHGAYFLLLLDYWRNGSPPDDDAVLAQITRLALPAWRRMRPVLVAYFKRQDGKLIHSRVESELVKAAENHDRRSAKAKKAADARWNAEASKTDAPSNAPSMPEALLGECPSPSPSSVTNVTGGEPPQDLAKEAFSSGVALLTSKGAEPKSARSLVGKWRKTATDTKLIGLIRQAREQDIADPGPWITASISRAANDTNALFASIQRTYGGSALPNQALRQ